MSWEKMDKRRGRKIFSSLRGRLTLWYLATVGLVFLLSSIAISSLLSATLQSQIDHHLHIVVNEAHQVVQSYQGAERDLLIRTLVSAQGMTVVVLSPDGSAVLETNSPDVALVAEHQLQRILTSSNLYKSSPTHFTLSGLRFAALPVQVNAGKGMVAVGYSTQVLSATSYKMLAIVSGVIVFLVLPITYLGYRLLKSQLRPLESIAGEAKSIVNTSHLLKRIDTSSSTEELRAIQEALNTMLAKLEGIFKGERDFFADAAHTLKTPLAILRSQIENATLPKNVQEGALNTINSANETVQDLLFLSQINTPPAKSEPISLTDLMNNLAELATSLGENKKLRVSAHIEADTFLKGDGKMLQRALSNVVFNAIAYNKPGGAINLSLKKSGGRINITVKDTGVGIPRQERPLVFTRFFRGSNVHSKGSGLGLAIAKSVVESMGGKIGLVSSLNRGTTVTVTFA